MDEEEVLVYDFGKSVHLLVMAGFNRFDAISHIEELAASDDPRAPMFVHTRYEPDDFECEGRPADATLH